ncbi:MAG: DUF192 domain-containing protein [Leptospirales bacterium]|nr:DUF192 domain-containing protein [Leptospirales bacterium]
MINFKIKYFALLVIALSIALSAENLNRKYKIFLFSESGKKVGLNIEIAKTPSERERGLMFRNNLGESDGMLFVFDKEENLNFWMKNTFIPLDIAYINKKGIINEIYYMAPVDISKIYSSIKPAMYALEVNAGWFNKNKIKIGSKIDFNGCLSK